MGDRRHVLQAQRDARRTGISSYGVTEMKASNSSKCWLACFHPRGSKLQYRL